MNADKIRSIVETLGKKSERDTVTYENNEYGYSSTQFVVLREIAAQLAELNAAIQSLSLDVENVGTFHGILVQPIHPQGQWIVMPKGVPEK